MRLKNSVVVHQPHFLPWPPYFAKLALCETFVVHDNVPYRRKYFHNRARILNSMGEVSWLSLPVHAHRSTALVETTIDSSRPGLLRHIANALDESYRTAPYFSSVWPTVKNFADSIASSAEMCLLTKVNVASIMLLLQIVDIEPPKIVCASALPLNPTLPTRTERLIDIINCVGAQALLTGWGASLNPAVHDLWAVSGHGVRVFTLNKDAAISTEPVFVSEEGLSMVHWLFNVDRNRVRNALLSFEKTVVALDGG